MTIKKDLLLRPMGGSVRGARRRRQAPLTHRALCALRAESMRLAPAARLPSERALLDRLGVSRVTLRRALALLKRDGLLRSEPGKGYFRASASSEPSVPASRQSIASVVLALTDLDSYNVQVVRTVIEVASQYGLAVIPRLNRHKGAEQVEDLRQLLHLPGLRGLIANPPLLRSDLQAVIPVYRGLQQAGLHVVLLNAPWTDLAIDNVSFDDATGMAMLTRHFLDLGHRCLAFVGEDAENVRASHRAQGFRQAMAAAGLRGLTVGAERATGGRFRFSLPLVEAVQRRRVTGFLAANEGVAFSVWTILREAGLRVPQDVSLAGFDRLSHISYGFPFSLTSVRRDREQLGQTAFRLWWSRCMAGGVPGATHQHLLLPTGLVPGDSCAEAPKGVSVGEAGFGRRSDSRRAMELASV